MGGKNPPVAPLEPSQVCSLVHEVARKHEIGIKTLLYPWKAKHVVRARHEAVQRLSEQNPEATLRWIAGQVGYRDITSVKYALNPTGRRRS